jgi:hypothetical protein
MFQASLLLPADHITKLRPYATLPTEEARFDQLAHLWPVPTTEKPAPKSVKKML